MNISEFISDEPKLLFTDRLNLEKLFEKWRAMYGNRPDNCAMNVVAFLDSRNLLDRKAVKSFLNNSEKENMEK